MIQVVLVGFAISLRLNGAKSSIVKNRFLIQAPLKFCKYCVRRFSFIIYVISNVINDFVELRFRIRV